MSIYERLMTSRSGARALSASRLRYRVLKYLNVALNQAGITQAELAKRLGIRRSAVNQVFNGDGNVRVNTLAEYLHEMGLEVDMSLVPLGTAREEAIREIGQRWQEGSRFNLYTRVTDMTPPVIAGAVVEWYVAMTSMTESLPTIPVSPSWVDAGSVSLARRA